MHYKYEIIMKYIILLIILSVAIYAQILPLEPIVNLDDLWRDFKEKFNKTYLSHHESRWRTAWEENFEKIQNHNRDAAEGLHSYFIELNHLADLSTQTYLRKMIKLTHSPHRDIIDPLSESNFESEEDEDIPEELDWRMEGFKMRDYNQKDCGACYAFSVANAIQAQIFKQTSKNVALSEQQIVDCSKITGNYGCSGGSLRNTMRYLEESGGLMPYETYPYVAKESKCTFDPDKVIVNISNWAILPVRDEEAMKTAVARIGPVAASINASPRTFQLYHKGIYDDLSCASDKVNHAMLIVGYTKDAWILKNWWGHRWGENGYMRLRRGDNRCGIANFVAYVEV